MGVMAYEHAGVGAATWLTVSVWSAITTIPVRAMPVFAAMLKFTDPAPVPLLVPVTVIQGTWLAADQAHPAAVATDTVAVDAPAAAGIEVGWMETVHVGSTVDDCATVTVRPARVNVPVLGAPVFG